MARFKNDMEFLVKSVGYGGAIGDALGVPVEFCSRKTLAQNPVTGMRGYGSHAVKEGTWSDDTSLVAGTLAAIVNNSTHHVNYNDIMGNFAQWRYQNEFTATGRMFDIGGTCSRAIHNYVNGVPALQCGSLSFHANGNGALMRIWPVAFIAQQLKLSNQMSFELTRKVSSLTHGHSISIIGCYLFIVFLRCLLTGSTPQQAYQQFKGVQPPKSYEDAYEEYRWLLDDNFVQRDSRRIPSSGYVVNTLGAALWSLLRSSDYKSAVLTAVNLGDDADTVGSVTGALAGAAYGLDDIPAEWISSLQRTEYLGELFADFAKALPEVKI